MRVAGAGRREASEPSKLPVAPRSRALAVGEVRIFLAVLVRLVDIAPAAAVTGANVRPPLGPSGALGPLPPPDLQRAGLGIVPPTAPLHVRLHRRQ